MLPACRQVASSLRDVSPKRRQVLLHRRGAAAALPDSPTSAKSASLGGVDRLLSMALRFLPIFECLRLRRFQVFRVLEAMGAGFYQAGAKSSMWAKDYLSVPINHNLVAVITSSRS